jgi:hypothetical protein
VAFTEDGVTGEILVIATYSSPDPAAPALLEKRFRTQQGQQAAFEAHLRAHSVVPCRWTRLVKGTCGDYPPEIVVPAFKP